MGRTNGENAVYQIKGDRARNLSAAYPEVGRDLAALIAAPELMTEIAADDATADDVAVADIRPALPVDAPPKIICLGLNYVDHIKEGGYDVPDYPALFMRSRNSLMAAGEPRIRAQEAVRACGGPGRISTTPRST